MIRYLLWLVIAWGVASLIALPLPQLEFLLHLLPWTLLLTTLSALIGLLRKHRTLGLILVFQATLFFSLLAPNIGFKKQPAPPESVMAFRILQFNINADNNRWDDLAEAIEQANADLFVICEANNHVLNRLKHLHSKYPHRIEVARWPNTTLFDASGTVLWSKFPFKSSEPIVLEKGGIVTCHAVLAVEETEVSVYAGHFIAPHTNSNISRRNAGLLEMADLLKKDPRENALLIGDLNNTLWTTVMRKLTKMGGVTSVFKSRMFFATWPQSLYPFGIAIDHIFYRGSLACTGITTWDGRGSDHRMLLAQMTLPTEVKDRAETQHEDSNDDK